jgi:large subunit ribosomal protein L24e
MVVKRSCSFCAGEIEPGTGTMFIKRDGAVFHFCSSSCRKQQLHLGRVGHRLKWTRAHAVKRLTEQSSAASRAAGSKSKGASGRPMAKPAEKEPATPAATSTAKAPEPTVAADAVEKPAPESAAPSPAAKKPRAKKPKEPASSA